MEVIIRGVAVLDDLGNYYITGSMLGDTINQQPTDEQLREWCDEGAAVIRKRPGAFIVGRCCVFTMSLPTAETVKGNIENFPPAP